MAMKFTGATATHYNYHLWLVFGSDGSVRLARAEPGVDRHERKMKLLVEIPRSLFNTPELHGTIKISDPDPAVDFKVNTSAAAEALRGALGVDIDLRVVSDAAQ